MYVCHVSYDTAIVIAIMPVDLSVCLLLSPMDHVETAHDVNIQFSQYHRVITELFVAKIHGGE